MAAVITEIGPNFWQLRSPEEDFHRNLYFKQFVGADGKKVNMIMDPGTKLDLNDLLPFLKEKIGGIQNIHMIFLSHQDPDLTANTTLVMSSAPKSFLITSVDTWRLVHMYGIPEKRMKTIESFATEEISIKATGHKIRFVPARYCHFRGAMMLYDYESRILFTGDLLGGVDSRPHDGTIFATEESWEGISLFHQLYMPSTVALKHAIETISMLDPFPEIIAPQHGDLITGENIHKFLARLSNLTVGAELLAGADFQSEKAVLAINNFLSFLADNHPEVRQALTTELVKEGDFTNPVVLTAGVVTELKVSPTVTFQQIIHILQTTPLAQDLGHLVSIFIDNVQDLGIDFAPAGSDEDDFEEIADAEDLFA